MPKVALTVICEQGSEHHFSVMMKLRNENFHQKNIADKVAPEAKASEPVQSNYHSKRAPRRMNHKWTSEQKQLVMNSPHRSFFSLSKEIGCSISAVKAMDSKLKKLKNTANGQHAAAVN